MQTRPSKNTSSITKVQIEALAIRKITTFVYTWWPRLTNPLNKNRKNPKILESKKILSKDNTCVKMKDNTFAYILLTKHKSYVFCGQSIEGRGLIVGNKHCLKRCKVNKDNWPKHYHFINSYFRNVWSFCKVLIFKKDDDLLCMWS